MTSARVAVLVLACALVAAHLWAGVRGVVVDEADRPVSGATVSIGSPDQPKDNYTRTATDSAGRWLLPQIPPGRWRLSVAAEGYQPSFGWAEVREGATPFVRLVLMAAPESALRPLLDEADGLLAQGRAAEARIRYERVLDALLESEQPPVLRSLARTYYLEKNLDKTVATLEEALLLAPRDPVSRELLLAVGDASGHRAEFAAWIERLDRLGPGALLEERLPQFELKALAENPTGRFRTRLEAPGPWGAYDTLRARVGGNWLDGERRTPVSEDQFEVYVPPLAEAGGRYGLFVWISPTPRGHVPEPAIRDVLDQRGVIWVGADRSGNERATADRLGLALDAAHAFMSAYPVDDARVWIGGYSGGGRLASALAVCYPEVFRGALLYMGANLYRDFADAQQPGMRWTAAFRRPGRDTLDLARRRSRLALVTGEFDFNRSQTRVLSSAYKADGFEHVTYVELPGVGHHYGLRRDGFEQGLESLEPRPGDSAPR